MQQEKVTSGCIRLTTQEVCALARISSSTLWRRISCGRFPPPVDRARTALFDFSEVQAALGRRPVPGPSIEEDIRIRLERMQRRNKKRLA